MEPIAHILLVEDDAAIATVVRDVLQESGYSCETIADGLLGLQAATQRPFDLVLLDLALPSLSGLDICRKLKADNPLLPVIMLTAHADEADVVCGLELGADDYIQKPFRPRELLARIRSRLRSSTEQKLAAGAHSPNLQALSNSSPSSVIVIGELRIDMERLRAWRNDAEVQLSAREFQVLSLLALNPGRPFSRDELLSHAWGFSSERYSVNVSIFMSRLRRKIEADAETPRYILTVRGIGYRFVEAHELSSPTIGHDEGEEGSPE